MLNNTELQRPPILNVTLFHENMSLRTKDVVEGDIHTQKDMMTNVSGLQFLMKGGHCLIINLLDKRFSQC